MQQRPHHIMRFPVKQNLLRITMIHTNQVEKNNMNQQKQNFARVDQTTFMP